MQTSDEAMLASGKPRFNYVYDQAVNATHDKLNGVLRSQLDVWHVPRTSGRQQILHASSHIIDTDVRQKVARSFHKAMLEERQRRANGLPSRPGTGARGSPTGGCKFRHDGTLEFPDLRRCASAGSATFQKPDAGMQWLPPWIDHGQWQAATHAPPPRWLGSPFAATAPGPALWAGATLPERTGLR
ncbi:unnamed protein product [Polarella glacialis]|uniref:Uncharacterized protein n=1 Tax=Polarella glacialis TaxID=89957 RepID=A0A813GE41_POLGL|nr:unnamed protein product [Polarella glacialis]|mmetsp:Transcript_73125/g.131715  ORF Transcript_73125/g.131715 Transcript_73125/m.131715 type:complete len:186 (-) Transcript_73125:174-731(-)